MKAIRYLLVILPVLAVLAGVIPTAHAGKAGGETTAGDVGKETRDLIQALKGYGAEQRDKAIARTKEALDRMDRRIDSLERKMDDTWDQMNQAARREARESLRTLHRQRTKLAEWYGSMKASSRDAWDHMKKGFSKAYEDLSDSWQKAEKEFGMGK
ncbi:MAG TPA: hypothetical protein PL090_04465 [Syntrophales bacterium]|nr:hypothetical protein [Syntrophales bacterium]